VSSLYLLDTDTCAFILRRSSPALLERIQAVPLGQQAISTTTVAELLYGVQVSSRKKANQAAVDLLIRHLAVLDWPHEAAAHYADIRADLKKRGQLIGANDLLIAAHARCIDAAVVTNNVKDFGRVKGLRVENWMA
jgi:tRNA(fMet)-specific endonuclease VapC